MNRSKISYKSRELRSKEEKLSNAIKEWQGKELELTNKIKELKRQLELERNVRKELEMLNSQKTFSIETVKSNDELVKFYTGSVLRTTRCFLWFLIFWGEKNPLIWTTGTWKNMQSATTCS